MSDENRNNVYNLLISKGLIPIMNMNSTKKGLAAKRSSNGMNTILKMMS